MKRILFSLSVVRTPYRGRYYIGAWTALGLESCEVPGARCRSTYASNEVAGNRHAICRFFVAYHPGNTLFRHGAGWNNDDSVARNRVDVGAASAAGRRRAGAEDFPAVGDWLNAT